MMRSLSFFIVVFCLSRMASLWYPVSQVCHDSWSPLSQDGRSGHSEHVSLQLECSDLGKVAQLWGHTGYGIVLDIQHCQHAKLGQLAHLQTRHL